MTKYIWLGIVWFSGWCGASLVQAGVIPPMPGSSGAVTLSIQNGTGADVTDTWLPEPGQSVTLVFNGNVAISSVSLAPSSGANDPTATSAYPGTCTNLGSPPDLSPDFTLDGILLTPTDCGGRAVIQVTGTNVNATFVIPPDSDQDGIPDFWEARFCPMTDPNCLAPHEDVDTGVGSLVGDNIANFDEYRGFIVDEYNEQALQFFPRVHIRTNPRQKDAFANLRNPECTDSPGAPSSSLLGGGAVTYPIDGISPFTVNERLIISTASAEQQLVANALTQVHTVGYIPQTSNRGTDEWVDSVASYSEVLKRFTFTAGSDPTQDRRINQNALYVSSVQKGARLMECLDVSKTTPLGQATLGFLNLATSDPTITAGSIRLFTQRVVNYFTNVLFPAGGNRRIRYYTRRIGDQNWVLEHQFSSSPPSAAEKNFILSKAVQFYLAHEAGHVLNLTTDTGSSSTAYGNHYVIGTGYALDENIKQTVDKKSSGFSNFYISSIYSTADQGTFILD
jgi:hypothetical protein